MIKLIASDIDGTLVVEGTNHINPLVFETILKLKEKGIYFAAASGRSVSSIEALFEPIKERIFYLADNGAYVGSYGRVLYATTIDREAAKKLILEIRKAGGCEIMVATDTKGYTDSVNQDFLQWIQDGYHMELEQVADLTALEADIIKISVHRPEQIEKLLQDPMPKFADTMKYTLSGDTWLDCSAPGVNKGAAIRLLQESLYVTEEETMVFGDNYNDVEMMKQAYHSYAMGNAVEAVKEAARYQADTNVNDGVLKILQTLL